MIDPRVLATMAKHLATAQLRLAELTRQEDATPMTSRTSEARIALARKIRVQRDLRDGWLTAVAAVESAEDAGAQDDAGLDKEFPPVPERTVAQPRERICALPSFMACDCNHTDGCQHPASVQVEDPLS